MPVGCNIKFYISNRQRRIYTAHYPPNRATILIAAMLLPEMYAIAMYPNSAIPAAACFIWALVSIIRNKHWAAILLMCIAPLFRLDVVIAYPAIFPLLIFVGRSGRRALLYPRFIA